MLAEWVPYWIWKSYPAIIHLSVWMNGEQPPAGPQFCQGTPPSTRYFELNISREGVCFISESTFLRFYWGFFEHGPSYLLRAPSRLPETKVWFRVLDVVFCHWRNSFSLVSSCVRIVKNVLVHALYYFLAFLKAAPNAAPVLVLQESSNRSMLP